MNFCGKEMLPLVTNYRPNPTKFILVPNMNERFGWACVVTRSEIWSELPLEINRMIVELLVRKKYECLSCGKFECDKEHEYYCVRCDMRLKRWRRQINRDYLQIDEVD